MRLTRALLARRMTYLTNLLYQKKLINTSMHIDSLLSKTSQTGFSFKPKK